MHKEAGRLALRDAVKRDKADVAVRERLDARPHLLNDLAGVRAAKHRQLPHGPVAVIVVRLHRREGGCGGGTRPFIVAAFSEAHNSSGEAACGGAVWLRGV